MVFENRFYITKEMYREYIHKVLCYKYYIVGVILLCIALFGFFFSLANHQTIATVEAVCGAIIFMMLLLTPRLMLKQLMEVDKSMHNGERPECVVTFGENIQMVEGQQSLAIEYGQIRKIYRLKTCSVLMFTRQNGIIFVEDRFTAGDPAKFEHFLLEKCVNAEAVIKR